MRLSFRGLAAATLLLSSVHAGVVVTGENNTNTNTASTIVAVSNTDLAAAANGATITNATTAGSAGVGTIGNLIDGSTVLGTGSVYFSDGSNAPDLLPNTQTITLNTSANPEGHNLTSIVTYAGWHTTGADLGNQDYSVSYATASSPTTFIPLTTVSYRPFADGTAGSSLTKVTITEDTNPFLATNVVALRFTFNPNGNTTAPNGAVYNEIDVFGTAPATTTDSVAISTPKTNAVIQRRADQKADIPITGSYNGTPDRIEARAVTLGGVRNGVPVASGSTTSWVTIATSPTNGTFSGTLPDVAAGGWYQLELRLIKDEEATASTQKIFGVGDVFITAGQSNSANHGSPAATPTDNRVVSLSALVNGNWGTSSDPQPIATGSGGSVWSRFGDLWTNTQNVPVAFVNVGVGSSATSSWLPTANNNYNRLRSAVQLFPANGFRAVLWHQGESDSIANLTASAHQSNMQAIINGARTDAGWTIPWYVSQASFHPNTNLLKEMPIAAGQRLLAWSSPNIILGPRTDDFHAESKVSDGVHFNATGFTDFANQWLDILQQSSTPVLKNPSFQSSNLADGGIFVVDNSTNSSPSIPGWQALSANGTTAADSTIGYYNPSSTFYSAAADTGSFSGVVPGMNGKQCGFIFQGSAECHLLQTLPQFLLPDTDYTLTVAIGRRISGTFGRARIEILGEGEVLASRVVNESDIAADSFKDFQVSYRSPESENASRQLAIKITKIDGSGSTYLDFDHVRFTAISSPYRQWSDANFVADSAISARNADPDGDGLINLFEYIFETNPSEKNTLPLPQRVGDQMHFSTNLRSIIDEPGFDLEYSFNLIDWYSASTPIHPEVLSERGATQWNIEIPYTFTDKAFLRFVLQVP